MANIKTRLKLRYDSLEMWASKNPTLLDGEVAIAYLPPKGTGDAPAATSTAVLMKVGPGAFNSLPFTSALAADVYAWAKEASLTINKDGTGNVVSGIEWDATANGGKGGIKFTTAAVATAEGLDELQKDVAAIEKDIADNRAAWAKDDNTTYTFAETTDGKGITITPSEGQGKTITFAFLTQAEIEALNYLVAADITTGSANGTIAVEGKDVAVKGLQDAAYTTVASLNATAKGYADAVQNSLGDLATKDSLAKADVGLGNVDNTSDADKPVSTAQAQAIADALAEAKGYADDNDTNTAHTHANGSGIKVTAEGGIAGEVVANLNVAFELVNNTIKLYDKDDASKTAIATLDASEFVKDSYLKDASYNPDTNILTFTFIDNEDNLQAIPVDLTDLVDVYTADEASLTKTGAQFSIKDGGVTTGKIADKNVTEGKLEQNVQDALALARTALQSHQDISGKADKATTITGVGYLAGGGDLSGDRTIDIDSAVKTKIDNGATAYSWGDHAEEGYLKADDITGKLDANGWTTSQVVEENGYVSKTTLGCYGNGTSVKLESGSGLTVEGGPTSLTYGPDGIRGGVDADTWNSPFEVTYYGITINDKSFSYPTQSGTLAVTKDITTAVEALDSSVAATAEVDGKVSVLTGVTQADGKLTAKTEVTLAKVAKTGSIYDVVESEGEYLIFDCGDASDWA